MTWRSERIQLLQVSQEQQESSKRMAVEASMGARSNSEPTLVVVPEEILTKKRSELWRLRQAWNLLATSDLFFPVDLKSIWRHHLIYSKKDGKQIIELVTARFATTLVVLSLLLSAEVGTYFSPSNITTSIRLALTNGPGFDRLGYSTGIVLILSQLFTLAGIVANYAALVLFRSLSEENAAIVLRSHIGLYAAQLPSRLTVLSLYLFVAWLVLFWWYNLRSWVVIALFLTTLFVMTHIFMTFSSLGRIILMTGAMGQIPILPKEEEEKRSSRGLSDVLLAEAEIERDLKTHVHEQYSANADDIDLSIERSYAASLKKRHPRIRLPE